MQDCQHPNCTRSSDDTYKDEHGNTLELCGRHYYELVSGKSVSNTLSAGVQFTRSEQLPENVPPTGSRISTGPTKESLSIGLDDE